MDIVCTKDVVFRRLGDTTFLCHLKTNRMFELNRTGARIWELLGAGLTREAVSAQLADEFEEPRSSVARHVDQLVDELLAAGLLQQKETARALASPDRRAPPASGWVLRWLPGTEFLPDLITAGNQSSTVSGVLGPAGNFIVFDGYLFDPGARGQSAAERVARGFAERGLGSIDDLRGAFTVVIWERVARRLIVIRDPLGIHPCYYAYDGKSLLLSADISSLLAEPEVTRTLNEQRLAEYVYRVTCSAQREETYFRDIKRVPPAHYMVVDHKGLRFVRYWDPLPLGFDWADSEASSALEATLERAVARCLSVGANSIALSGGFDSIAIACLSSRLTAAAGRGPPVAVSLHFKGMGVDESDTQRAVARALGMQQRLDPFPACDLENTVVRGLEHSAATGPVLSPWQWMYESLLTGSRDLGASRMMFGSGGDEMFNVDATFAGDLLARLDLRGLFAFVRAWQRTSPMSPAYVFRYIVWTHGLRRLVSDGVRSHLPLLSPRVRRTPGWAQRMRLLGANAALIESMTLRLAESGPTPSARGEGRYVRTLRDLVRSPAMLDEFEQSAGWAMRAGVELLYPYFDREFVALALRLKPETLYAAGRMKTPLRGLVEARLKGIPRKKVDFTEHANSLLRAAGPRAWQGLRDLGHLARLGIVEGERARAFVKSYFAGGESKQFWATWAILSAEDWLRRYA